MTMKRVVIFIFAAAVVQQGEKFDHTEVRAGLRCQQTPVLKHAQPVIPTVEAAMPQLVARDQKLEEAQGDGLGGDERG